MERFITACVQFRGQPGPDGTLAGAELKTADGYRPALRCVSLDIETSVHGELYSIALEGCGQRQVYMLGPPNGGDSDAPNAVDFNLDYCDTRPAMLARLNEWFDEHDPDAVIGWNLVQFDLRILHAHSEQYGIPLKLGRGGSVLDWRAHGQQPDHFFAGAAGRLILDGIDMLKSATWTFPSFSLEYVSQALLGEGKSIDNPYQRMDEIQRRFDHDKPALARYNLKDCGRHAHLRQGRPAVLRARTRERDGPRGRSHRRVGGGLHASVPAAHAPARLCRAEPRRRDGQNSPGGFVMDSRPGLYDSVLVFDYKSLYPSIIRTFLIDPVGLIEGAHPGDDASVPGFRRTFLAYRALPARYRAPRVEGRDDAKRQRNAPLSQALKIIMNSFYGVLGSTGCRFFDPRLASSITMRGHEIMHRTRELIEAQGYEVIYGDTDSTFVWLGRAHDDDEAGTKGRALVEHVNRWWQTHLRETFAESALELQYERHYRRFLMPTVRGAEEGSKKRYAAAAADGGEDLVFKPKQCAPTGRRSRSSSSASCTGACSAASRTRISSATPCGVRWPANSTTSSSTASACAGRCASTSATCRRTCARRGSPTSSTRHRAGRCSISAAAGSAT